MLVDKGETKEFNYYERKGMCRYIGSSDVLHTTLLKCIVPLLHHCRSGTSIVYILTHTCFHSPLHHVADRPRGLARNGGTPYVSGAVHALRSGGACQGV